MSEPNSILMRFCTENVYHDNIFHLLGLRTTATPRQVRRRREDFESAKTLGADTWRAAFKHLMGTRTIPTPEEVDEAFDRLEDPEFRLVSEFFWPWPMDDDRAIDLLVDGRKNEAFGIWEHEALGCGKRRTIAKHNLAVVYHLYALDAELQILDGDGYAPPDFKEKMLSYWEKCISYWEGLADNDDLWDLYETRMREFDDPRLTGGFVRRFRSEFPVAFDNINARLAARYAKLSRFDDAKRHVDYMCRTMSGLDDVQENMNIIFNPMEKRVALLVGGYDEKVKNGPQQGFECACRLMKETEEIRRVAEGMLKDGQRIRTGIFTQIVTSCNRYLVQYGNKTEMWDACLKMLESLQKMACTPESKKLVDGNIETIRNNIRHEKQKTTCLCCGRENVTAKKTVHLHTRITFDDTWRNLDVDVCMCKTCQFWHGFRIFLAFVLSVGLGILIGVGLYSACDMGAYSARSRYEDAFIAWLIMEIIACIAIFNFYLHIERDKIFKLKTHPRIAAARKKKFHYGAMSQELAGAIVWIRNRVIMLLLIGIFVGIVWICGC